ncbi:MAG: hypothetical protein ACFFCW_30540 [Candidatus Hodarchaeota archaeon]
MKPFFENVIKLEKMRDLSVPSRADLVNVLGIIKEDVELTLYFYDKLNPSWLELLEGVKEFEGLNAKEAGFVERYKVSYLFECAETNPEAVLRIIKGVVAKDEWVRGKLAGAIAKMPEQISVKAVPIVLDYVGKRKHIVWFFAGEETAKLMMKLVGNYPEEALKIAKALLDIWRPGKKEAGVFERIRSKFATHEYKELIFNYYSKVWENRPFDAICVLVDIYDKYLDECFKEKNYDVSEYLGVSLRDLEDDYHLDRDIEAILVKAMCEAGRAVIEKGPDKVTELLENLEKRNKGVFHRIEMYLLRFVSAGAEKDRINKIISNQKFIESPYFKYEHRQLLNDKFDEVSKETLARFIEWVSQQKITNERKKEVEEWCQKNNKELPDFEKWENQAKAEELYLVRERGRFKELYEEYRAKSGLTDAALAPRPMVVSETRRVSPEEGSPYSSEKMGNDNVENVVNYLLDPKNYEGMEKVSGWGTAKDSLAASFKTDVKKRPMEYLNVDLKKLEHLDSEFLEKFFYGIGESVRDGSFKKEGWELLIDLACGIVENNNKGREWQDCYLAILWVLHDGFEEESNRIEFNETIIRKLWLIFKELVRYNYDENLESEEDPFQRRLRSVQGSAFGQVVSLGIVCKKDFLPFFEAFLRKESEEVYKFVVEEVKRSEVNCTFGSDFARIYWLDREWVESNIENIFNDEMWDAVWGTYVSWGRPSPQGFKFLVKKGIYGRAIEKIGEKNQYKFNKEPDEGLIEHLMIGYFNGWVDFESDVLKQFFDKASAELRGKAARFLTTGFKSVNEEGGTEKEKVATRMREYWKNRLAAIKDKTKENEKEAIELVGWVEDSVLPAKETLGLLEMTLDLSGGKIGEMRDAKDFIEGVCKLGKGNELLALHCLNKAAADENMHRPWAGIQEPLVSFLENLPEDVRGIGREVADLYGRYNPDKFRGVWEKFNATRGNNE